jgi:ubiquinone/menaquinone biosynthesis C-methylase UbiE
MLTALNKFRRVKRTGGHSSPGTNWWPSAACAKAFWAQQDCKPYQELLADTLDLADPKAGERWLDLGCGGGALTRAIWGKTNGTVGIVVGLDCAAENDRAYRKMHDTLGPGTAGRIQFVHHNFSAGLGLLPDDSFDHAVSGLSITYAESFDEKTGTWTTAAYDRLLADVRRVLRPGGRFVFSVNVPEPAWARVAWHSLPGLFASGNTLRHLKRSVRMLRYGSWLKREARTGRFHYLPAADVTRRLANAGFVTIEHRLSYCNQAYVFRAVKPD